jgi:hypothetical protein
VIVFGYRVDGGALYHNPLSSMGSTALDRLSVAVEATGLVTAPTVISRGLWQSYFGDSPEVIYLQVPHSSVMALDAARREKLAVGQDDVYNQDHNWGDKYQKAEMIVGGEEYDIKLRTKGDRAIHYEDPLHQSYRVDLRGDKRFHGMEEFNLHKPIMRNYAYEWVFHTLVAEGGLIAPQYDFAHVQFNGVDAGLFAIEESFGRELVERNQRRYGPIFGIDETKGIHFPEILFEAYSEGYWRTTNPALLEAGYSILNRFRDSAVVVEDYFDLDAWAYYFAVADLTGAWHGTVPKSVKFFLNPVTAKIEPISFDGHAFIGEERYLLIDLAISDEHCGWVCDHRAFFRRFFLHADGSLNADFTGAYLGHLERLSSEAGLPAFLDRHEARLAWINDLIYADFSRTDRVFWKGVGLHWFDQDLYAEQVDYVRRRIAGSGLQKFIVQNMPTMVRVESFSATLPARLRVSCGGSGDGAFDGYVIGAFKLEKSSACRTVTLHTLASGWAEYPEKANYQLTEERLPDALGAVPPVSAFGRVFTRSEDGYRLSADMVRLADTARVPTGDTLRLGVGQTLELAGGAVLVVSGILALGGSAEAPARIVGTDGGGAVVVSGGGLEARQAEFSGLGAPGLEGYILYGGLNVISGEAAFEDVTISNASSEDAVNFVSSEVEITSLTIANAASDALDSDFSRLRFDTITCRAIQNDCLDTSGSTVSGQRLEAHDIGDKGLSLGEASKVEIAEVVIAHGEIGIVVKDASEATIEAVSLSDVRLAVAVFEKKPEYGPAQLTVNSLTDSRSDSLMLVDRGSSAMVNGEALAGASRAADIEARLYGNEFGRATER